MAERPALPAGIDLAPLFGDAPQEHVHDVYRALRAEAPVAWLPAQRTWLVSAYDDVRAVVRDPATWSSVYPERFGTGLVEAAPPSPRVDAVLAGGYPWIPTLLFQDGPDHRRHRAALMRVMTPAWVRSREDAIAAVAHGLVDAFPADGRVRLVRDYAAPLPIAVFAQAFGVAPEDGERFRAWADDLVRLGAGADEDENVRLAEQYVAFQRYLAGRIAASPSDAGDLLSGLAAAQREDGGTVSTAELLSIGTLLLAAGNDTTTAALGSLVHRLLDDPALAAALRADRSLLPAAIEETLRLDSPLQMFQRRAVRDTELRGLSVRRGDMAMVLYGAANRDPARFPDPDAFRLDRPNGRDHLAFTQGPHHCAGAVLARAELRVATTVLLDRTTDLSWDRDAGEPAAPAAFLPDLLTRAHREIPVRVTAAAGSPAA